MKQEQKKLITEIMNDDAKDRLYISPTKSNADMNIGFTDQWKDTTPNIGGQTQQTAVEWLSEQIKSDQNQKALSANQWMQAIEQAKQMEKQQMIKFAEFVAAHPDKNKNYLGEMLHAKSKYDSSERTIDLLEQYYNETYNK